MTVPPAVHHKAVSAPYRGGHGLGVSGTATRLAEAAADRQGRAPVPAPDPSGSRRSRRPSHRVPVSHPKGATWNPIRSPRPC
ncbi:hypothetical protein SAM9427_23030 [Streptomyces sp. ETH9427]|nr:hypothetical protein SAM9427_23030 [Streptomyces sp. ETH9427]